MVCEMRPACKGIPVISSSFSTMESLNSTSWSTLKLIKPNRKVNIERILKFDDDYVIEISKKHCPPSDIYLL